jgi:hypothetical protein
MASGKDPIADYIGAWRRYKIEGRTDYSFFAIHLDKPQDNDAKNGLYIDNLGSAKISGLVQEGTEIRFTKKDNPQNRPRLIQYVGHLTGSLFSEGEDFDFYNGAWGIGTKSEGTLILVPKSEIKSPDLADFLFRCERDCLNQRIHSRRWEFPYLHLR